MINLANKHLGKICDFYKTWRLKLNPTKTEAVWFNAKDKNKGNKINIENKIIEWSKTCRYLGIWLDEKMNWKA